MQSALHAMAKPSTQSSSLPPLQNLPSWSRSGLQRKKEQRSINRDRLEPINFQTGTSQGMENSRPTESNKKSLNTSSVIGRIVSAPSSGHELDSRERVLHLEKSFEFLQEQHSETLGSLHREIERLKSENKELNFRLVMAKSGINVAKAESPEGQDNCSNLVMDKAEATTSVQDISKEKQVNRVTKERQSVAKSAGKPQHKNLDEKKSLHRQFSAKKMTRPTPPASAKNSSAKSRSSAKVKQKSKAPQPVEGQKMDGTVLHATSLSKQHVKTHVAVPPRRDGRTTPVVFMVTLSGDSKVKVHIPSETEPRSPTLSECNAIIRQQQETNVKQAQELSKLKMDLKDAKYAQNSLGVPHVITKAYNPDANRPVRESFHTEYRPLPKLNTHQAPRLTNRMRLNQESISLPALRPNLNPTVAERRKRQQTVLRGRSTTAKRDF